MALTVSKARKSLVRKVIGSKRLQPLNDFDALDEMFRGFNTILSPKRIRARVVETIAETADARTIVLHPNLRWRGFTAGQHTVVEVEINGRRYHRSYSLSSNPGSRSRISITVKRQAGGKVSNYLHDGLKVGDILTLSPPFGEFVVDTTPAALLMLSAGSGITPMMAMLRQLKNIGYDGDIRFVHVCRSPADAIFAGEIQQLTTGMPGLKPEWHYTAGGKSRPGLARLLASIPDAGERQTLLCGPQDFMGMIEQHWRQSGWSQRLKMEHFAAPLRPMIDDGSSAQIECRQSGHSFTANSSQPLLFEAERAGLEVRNGCRIGICRACRYRKTSGVVENLVTGQISAEPNEMIQLCICVARSDIELQDL